MTTLCIAVDVIRRTRYDLLYHEVLRCYRSVIVNGFNGTPDAPAPDYWLSLSLTIGSSNLVVSRAPYATGAPQWPKGDCRPYFGIGLAFYQCSRGVIAINECRRKYAAKFGVPFRPCAGKRIFYNIPRQYLESCIDFVRDYYIKQSSFPT